MPQQSNARLVKILQILGVAEERRGQRQNAITHYHASLVYMDRHFQPKLYAETLRTLGKLYAERNKWDECQKALAEALEIEFSMNPRSEERIAETLRLSANAYRDEGHLEKSANAFKKMATHANLSKDDATQLRSTLNEIDRYKATLSTALDSMTMLEKSDAELKDYAFVYALIVRMYFLLSEFEHSRNTMNKLVKFLQARADDLDTEDERADYRSLAHFRLALLNESRGDNIKARDHYRLALKDNTDAAMKWLIEQSMGAVV